MIHIFFTIHDKLLKGSEVIQVLASGSALAPLIEAQWQTVRQWQVVVNIVIHFTKIYVHRYRNPAISIQTTWGPSVLHNVWSSLPFIERLKSQVSLGGDTSWEARLVYWGRGHSHQPRAHSNCVDERGSSGGATIKHSLQKKEYIRS